MMTHYKPYCCTYPAMEASFLESMDTLMSNLMSFSFLFSILFISLGVVGILWALYSYALNEAAEAIADTSILVPTDTIDIDEE